MVACERSSADEDDVETATNSVHEVLMEDPALSQPVVGPWHKTNTTHHHTSFVELPNRQSSLLHMPVPAQNIPLNQKHPEQKQLAAIALLPNHNHHNNSMTPPPAPLLPPPTCH